MGKVMNIDFSTCEFIKDALYDVDKDELKLDLFNERTLVLKSLFSKLNSLKEKLSPKHIKNYKPQVLGFKLDNVTYSTYDVINDELVILFHNSERIILKGIYLQLSFSKNEL